MHPSTLVKTLLAFSSLTLIHGSLIPNTAASVIQPRIFIDSWKMAKFVIALHNERYNLGAGLNDMHAYQSVASIVAARFSISEFQLSLYEQARGGPLFPEQIDVDNAHAYLSQDS
ncbi:hypothetical protein F5B20DRAFT_585531 [Whalleya microplaca]|nr:hypothetical protein F5B20DRAFT_585531 [Whalleya microplaca]